MPRVAPITGKFSVRVVLHTLSATVRRHRAWLLVPCVLAVSVASGFAQEKSQKAAPPSTSAPTSEADSFVYVAPSFIKELDSKYPLQPPVPPSPPRYGGVLHFPAVVRAFDPTVGYRPELALVWDTLTEWESTWYYPEVQRTPVIRKTLATSWEMKNPSTWIFRLRQGVKFHNRPPVNGREMTAEDVKYSYELLKDKAQYANRAAMVKTIHVVDKYTLRFELKLPDPKFYLNVVDSLSPVIVPREAVEAPGGLAENPIGTGAFMLKEFSPGEGALLVKNPDYYLKDKDGRQLPYVDAVRLVFTKDASTEMALFRTKQLDIMRVSTLDLLYALIKTVPDLGLYRVPSLGWGDYGLALALDKAPFNDVRVRQALSMAINRDVIAEVINRGDATLYGPFPWVMAGHTKRADYSYANLGPNYQHNPKRAKELLAAAGFPILGHAFKNALIPVVTVVGQQFSVLLGGTVIVEFIFLQPGVGSLLLDAVQLRDYTVIQGAVLFFAAVIVFVNLLVDVSYAWLDPRIRYR